MKKTIAILLAVCMCVGLCACSSGTGPKPFEDTFAEIVKNGDPASVAHDALGEPECFVAGIRYEYQPVDIYDGNFRPMVLVDENGIVREVWFKATTDGYKYNITEETFRKIVENFTRIYGEPAETVNRGATYSKV